MKRDQLIKECEASGEDLKFIAGALKDKSATPQQIHDVIKQAERVTRQLKLLNRK